MFLDINECSHKDDEVQNGTIAFQRLPGDLALVTSSRQAFTDESAGNQPLSLDASVLILDLRDHTQPTSHETWRRFSQPLTQVPFNSGIDFARLTPSKVPRYTRVGSYSAPKAYQSSLENCAKLLKPLGGEVAEWLNAAVC